MAGVLKITDGQPQYPAVRLIAYAKSLIAFMRSHALKTEKEII